jgi:hypothetical protein
MRAAWYVRSRQMLDKAYYWLAITGYNSNDRSLNNRLYLIYVFLFFGAWGLAVFGLLTAVVTRALTLVSPAQPVTAAVALTALLILLWWLRKLFGAAQRSPIRFTPEDATLICATPVSRPGVVFSWLVGEWFVTGVPFWGLAITLGFTLVEIEVGSDQFWPNVGRYMASGARVFLPVLLLHLGLLMWVWILGFSRLQRSREQSRLYLIPLSIVLLSGLGLWVALTSVPGLEVLAFPILLPILSGCGLAGYGSGLTVASAWVILGAIGLFLSSRSLSLARAAQETETRAAISAAKFTGSAQTAREIHLKERLQSHRPSRLPARTGPAAIVWGQTVRTLRAISLGDSLDWLLLFGLMLGFSLAPNWLTRAVVFLIWMVRWHERVTTGLRSDLAVWTLFQSLPLRLDRRLLAELLPRSLAAAVIGWVAWICGSALGFGQLPPILYIIMPFLALSTAYSAAFDVLRQTKPKHLSTGNIPLPGIAAVLLSALIFGANYLLLITFGSGLTGFAAALLGNGLILWATAGLCSSSYLELGQ